ncbi:hypothetical protein [Methylocystis parvus]|uniref:hypothetical protein n=1 Tax=Methylocystis parvus TaxID=134 RepID=UPI003C7839D1
MRFLNSIAEFFRAARRFASDALDELIAGEWDAGGLVSRPGFIDMQSEAIRAVARLRRRADDAERRAARNGLWAVAGWGLLAIAAVAAILGLAL